MPVSEHHFHPGKHLKLMAEYEITLRNGQKTIVGRELKLERRKGYWTLPDEIEWLEHYIGKLQDTLKEYYAIINRSTES